MKSKSLLNEILKLPRRSRAILAGKILESLESAREEALDIWIEEADRRWQGFKAGKLRAIPAKEIFPSLRKTKTESP
jgi:putative addiction module component (TIGR02574 family)